MLDHIVKLVEAKAAEIEAADERRRLMADGEPKKLATAHGRWDQPRTFALTAPG